MLPGFIPGANMEFVPMWTLLVPVAVALIPTIVVLGLFKAAGLKRAEDFIPPPEVDEWDRLREYERQNLVG
jgi:hypothetical protein